MKRFGMNKLASAALVLAIGLTFTACGSGSAFDSIAGSYSDMALDWDSPAYEEYNYEDGYYKTESSIESGSTANSATSQVAENRKLITNVSMDLETREFDALLASVQNRVKGLGGYVESLDNYNGSKYNSYSSSKRYAYITARIPKNSLDDFLNAVSEEGNVTQRNENVEDVTLSYVDMESRRDMLRKEQERLMEFMDYADTIEEMITIEERLSEVRYQIESMESRLRTYDNQIDFCTVRINITEVEVLTPVQEEGALERMAGGFMENLLSVLIGIRDFLIGLVINLPTLIFVAIIIAIGVLIYKKLTKKKKQQVTVPVYPAEPVMVPPVVTPVAVQTEAPTTDYMENQTDDRQS